MADGISAVFGWISLFLCPFLLFGVIGWIVKNYYSEGWGITLIVTGVVLGIILAEYIRRKTDLNDYNSQLSSSKDIDEWLKKEREKLKNK